MNQEEFDQKIREGKIRPMNAQQVASYRGRLDNLLQDEEGTRYLVPEDKDVENLLGMAEESFSPLGRAAREKWHSPGE